MDVWKTVPIMLILLRSQLLVCTQSTTSNCSRYQQFNFCFLESGYRSLTPIKTGLDCAIECSMLDSCASCSFQTPSTCKLVSTSTTDEALIVRELLCDTKIKVSKRKIVIDANCPKSLLFSADILVKQDAIKQTLMDFLCYPACLKALSSAQEYQFVRLNFTAETNRPARCLPMNASDFFNPASSLGSGVLPIAVSTRWKLQFVEERLCTDSGINNVPPVKNASWAQPLQLDICAMACLARPSCEFFIFNSTGCFEGSLSLYLNSRMLQGVYRECSIQHKLRSWAQSAVAFYTFNSSWLNLIDKSVMPAMRSADSKIEVFSNGFQVPQETSGFVRIDLAHFRFDSRIRTQAPMTFVIGYSRQLLQSYRSQILLFANCTNSSVYNGDMSERSDRNEFWFVNSLTGQWQVYTVHSNVSYHLPGDDMIRLAIAVNGTSGYFVVNGIQAHAIMTSSRSTYGSNGNDIACLYLGHRPPSMPFSAPMNGRIQLLGIFSEMLSVEQINELF